MSYRIGRRRSDLSVLSDCARPAYIPLQDSPPTCIGGDASCSNLASARTFLFSLRLSRGAFSTRCARLTRLSRNRSLSYEAITSLGKHTPLSRIRLSLLEMWMRFPSIFLHTRIISTTVAPLVSLPTAGNSVDGRPSTLWTFYLLLPVSFLL